MIHGLAHILFCCVLANPGADLERLRVSGHATPERVAAVIQEGLASQVDGGAVDTRSEAQRCADAFVAGEWCRVAARLVPEADYGEQALGRFRAMRLDFPKQPTSWLGYVGEARVYRQRGDLEKAAELLNTVVNPEAPVPAAVRDVAHLDRLEIDLLRDPAVALARSEERGEEAAWVRARALSALGRDADAAAAAREPGAVSRAPAYDRLQLLAESGHANDAEWSAWVELLVGLNLNAQALTALDARTPTADRGRYATLLYHAGRRAEAADQWEAVLADAPADRAAQWYAAVSLTQAAAEQPGLIPRAQSALLRVAENQATEATRRRDALRWWTQWAEPAEKAEVLIGYRDLIAEDIGLRYRLLAAQLELEEPPGDTVAELLMIERGATGDDGLRAAAVLTRTQQMRDNPRAALAVLEEHGELLAAHPHTAEPARRLRVRLWIKAGVLDPALDAVSASPEAHEPTALLELAEALVQREAGRGPGETFSDTGRARVTRLVSTAVAKRPDDDVLTLRGTRLLMAAEAWSDVSGLLRGVETPEGRLLQARALLRQDRVDEAWAALEGLDTPAVSVLRSGWLLDQGRAEDAITPARTARAASEPGSDLWWEATCALVAAQLRSGRAAAASDVLRVAEVLHPVGTRAALRRRVETLREELSP